MALSRRRGTLEPMSTNGFNLRQSMGLPGRGMAARASLGPSSFDKAAKPHGRASLYPGAPGMGGVRNSNGPPRKSSTGLRKSTTYGHGGRQDPRPNTDKGYIQTSIRGLINYLTDHNYDHPFSTKILQRPTAKDFTYIISFLFRQVDPNFRITGKLEDEVIAFFKALHYPFPISKASMQAVGTMHTWPTLLASITWIVELLTYDEEVQSAQAGQDPALAAADDERAEEKLLFEYLGTAYKAFLDGDDDRYAELEQGFVGTFEARCREVEAQCAAIEGNVARMREQIEACHQRRDELPGLQQQLADYQSDLGKFKTLIEQLTAHREGLQAKVAKRTEELAALQGELERAKAETGGLREVVAAQEFSPADVQRMCQERARLEEAMAKASEHKTKMRKELWEAEMELSRTVVGLENAAQTFNGKAAALQLIPITAKNSNGIRYEMTVAKAAVAPGAEPQELVGVDIKGVIRPSLAQIKAVIIDKVHEARTSVLRMLDEEATSEEELAEAMAELTALESKVKKQDETYKAEKVSLEQNMTEKSAELERVEAQVMSLRSQTVVELESQAARNTQRLGQLQAELAVEREEHEAATQAIQEAIMGTLHALADHKEEVKRRLGEYREYCVQKRDLFLAQPAPFAGQPQPQQA